MKITKKYLNKIIKEELQKEIFSLGNKEDTPEQKIIKKINNLQVNKNWAGTLRTIGRYIVSNKIHELKKFGLSLRKSDEGINISNLIEEITHYIPTVKDKSKQLYVARLLDDKAEKL